MNKGSVEDGLVYHAGFPNAGEDQQGVSLSLDRLIVRHAASTYFWRLEAGAPELHWSAGTIVVVDRSLPPSNGRIVVALVDEAFTLVRYGKQSLRLLDGTQVGDGASVWGVVTYVVAEVR